jgi:hypothetical protein
MALRFARICYRRRPDLELDFNVLNSWRDIATEPEIKLIRSKSTKRGQEADFFLADISPVLFFLYFKYLATSALQMDVANLNSLIFLQDLISKQKSLRAVKKRKILERPVNIFRVPKGRQKINPLDGFAIIVRLIKQKFVT